MRAKSLIGLLVLLGSTLVGQAAPEQGAVGLHPPVTPRLPAPVLVIRNPDVQDELRLSHTQKVSLAQIRTEVDDAIRLFLPQPGHTFGGSPAGWDEFDEIVSYGDDRLKSVLTPRQWVRLREIRVQLAGPFAVLDPEVANAIGLEPEQVERIAMALRGRRHGPGHDQTVHALLRPDQWRKLRILEGRAFFPGGAERSM